MLPLYVDTTDNALLVSANNGSTIDPHSLPLFYGDTIQVQVYLFQRVGSASAGLGTPFSTAYQSLGNNGALSLYLTNGLAAGSTVYASCLAFQQGQDAGGPFYGGTLALNTVPLQTLIGSSKTATAFLQLSLAPGGQIQTVFSRETAIGVGVPSGVVPVPVPPLTALSLQQAMALFFPLNPVAGQTLELESPNGHIFVLRVKDNPDGSASFNADQLT